MARVKDRVGIHTRSIRIQAWRKRGPNSVAPSFGVMRNAILQLPPTRTASDQRLVFGAAMRQLEPAEIYLAAVACMELDDRGAKRALNQLRTDLESLRRHVGERRDRVTD